MTFLYRKTDDGYSTEPAEKREDIHANVPLDTSGPLPKTLASLEFVPAERRACYARKMDGSFALRFLHSDDTASFTEYSDDVAAGRLRTFKPGDSPEATAARVAEAQRASDAIVANLDAEEARAREAALAAEKAKAQADVERRFARPQ